MILRYFTLIGVILLTYSCSSNEPADEKETITVIAPTVEKSIPLESFETFVDFDKKGILSSGLFDLIDEDRFIFKDADRNIFFVLNEQGEIQYQFGRKGKGPGEFWAPNYATKQEDRLFIKDQALHQIHKFDMEGNYIGQYPYRVEGSMGAVGLLEDSIFVAAAGGFNNALLVKKDLNSGATTYFGKPKGAFVEHDNQNDVDRDISVLANGNLPGILKNRLYLQVDRNFIYVFLHSYSELRKYNHHGKLIWQRKLDLPANDELFERAIESAKITAGSNIHMVPAILYIMTFKVYNGEEFVLTFPTANTPELLLRIDPSGNLINSYQFPTFRELKPESMVTNFVYKPSTNTLYVQSYGSNEIKMTTL